MRKEPKLTNNITKAGKLDMCKIACMSKDIEIAAVTDAGIILAHPSKYDVSCHLRFLKLNRLNVL